jgi:hypothetical protein
MRRIVFYQSGLSRTTTEAREQALKTFGGRMGINAQIIDQQVNGLAERRREELQRHFPGDEQKQISAAFVILAVKNVLDIPEDEALDCLTEGGNDFGVDAIKVGDLRNFEFPVTLFQGKYRRKFDGTSAFPQTGLEKMLQAIGMLFDPTKSINLRLNPALEARIEEIRSLITDGNMPQVRALLCNNGEEWTPTANALIKSSGLPKGQVRIEHVNHDKLVSLLQSSTPVDETLRLTGTGLVEDFDFSRVLVGKIPVANIKELFDRHGDRLLEQNIRRYLGQHGNRVNEGIARTLDKEPNNFYFYNNGVTIVCKQFQHNALQQENWQVKISGLHVINGGQTCKTIQQVLSDPEISADQASVMVRVYELPEDQPLLVRAITYATNSQNPVDLRNLRSSDALQKTLASSIEALGYDYHPQRSGENITKATDITSLVAAEAVFSIWRQRPHQAKFRSAELFGTFYNTIFTENLNGAQVVIAVLLFRIAENRRKRPRESDPDAVRYGSCFYAMLMGAALLEDLGIRLSDLNHRNFEHARKLIETRGDAYFEDAIHAVENALRALYKDENISLQRLSATFRREDLIEKLPTAS